MRFQIRRAIRNLYRGLSLEDGKEYDLRIKGKVLKVENTYNPIAVGDIAIGNRYSQSEALIDSLEERKSSFTRWNSKAEVNQTISANQDLTVIVVSYDSPPFRPRFLDRAISCSFNSKIIVIANKCDLKRDNETDSYLDLYDSLGFSVIRASVMNNTGLDQIKDAIQNKISCFVGQSGVGKSSIINALMGTSQRVGDISQKYNRGKHTTNYALYLEGNGFSIIDTPGVREIIPPLEDERSVIQSFPELMGLRCQYSTCLHDGEDGCLVPEYLERGLIAPDRYDSYLRILSSIRERTPIYLRKKRSGRKDNQGPGAREDSGFDKSPFSL